MRLTELRLEAFIEEVIERTMLMPHYYQDGYSERAQVNLVGHSMGGLLVAGYLQRLGKNARVGKVATLGTPFRGSHEAVTRVATGLDRLGIEPSPSREREAARITPALYHLVPHYEGAVIAHEGVSADLFTPSAWQSSVPLSVAQYVRLYSVVPSRTPEQIQAVADALFSGMLDDARTYCQRVDSLDLVQTSLGSSDGWLCVVGVGERTRVRTRIVQENDKQWFDLDEPDDTVNQWPDGPTKTDTGDTTVPYLGAKPAFLKTSSLICVCRDDFSWTEIGDRLISKFGGLHGALPLMNLNHRLIASHFLGVSVGDLWGRRPPDLDEDWVPPLKGLKGK